ncbi:MAG TPA: ammonia channel protein [Prevotella sp.]|nr:ammonia channel protein [Prevotella sp.]
MIDTGNTAWITMSTILVMFMTIPALALFYGGLVRSKNILSILMQCLICTAVGSLLWIAIGYSWVFGTNLQGTPFGFFIGGYDKVFLHGITIHSVIAGPNIPEITYVLFQCMFAVITPALIIGAFAERLRFPSFLLFTVLWSILIYYPMAHFVWGGGWLQKLGAIDFAGGTVVHINAGISALIMALLLGKRADYKPNRPIPAQNVPFVFMGAAMLWLGWFGFNAGSGLTAGGLDANAFLVTHVATCAAAIVWMVIDWVCNDKPTTVGMCTGAVAGLVAITPAAGSVDVFGAICIGSITSIICYFMVAVVKRYFGYDDALDAFGVHGMGGIIGSILTGVFATKIVTGGPCGAIEGDWHQLGIQVLATLFSIIYSSVITFILYKVIDRIIGMRVELREEEEGLDVYEHSESAYN